MLNQIELRCFKCFELLKLPLAPLTLLSGPNASGKSSVLQSLVLLHQTMREHECSTRLVLNGDGIRLDTAPDVIDEVFGRTKLGIALEFDGNVYDWNFQGERQDMSMEVQSVSVNGQTHNQPQELRHLLPQRESEFAESLTRRLRGLTYITAERIAPHDAYEIRDPNIVSVVGPRGNHAVSILHWGRDEFVLDDLVLPDAPPIRLRQVEARMRTLFPEFRMELQQVPRANTVTLGLRTSDATDFHSPIHTGLGITQVLPIVIASLSAKKGDLILIENPEVHLHPAGQALMGQFLTNVARAGIQVLAETHSDHVLNGVRRAVKSKRLAAGQVAIHFFRPRSEDRPQVLSPVLDESGNIDSWPEGFFDQFDKDTNYFAGWGD